MRWVPRNNLETELKGESECARVAERAGGASAASGLIGWHGSVDEIRQDGAVAAKARGGQDGRAASGCADGKAITQPADDAGVYAAGCRAVQCHGVSQVGSAAGRKSGVGRDGRGLEGSVGKGYVSGRNADFAGWYV